MKGHVILFVCLVFTLLAGINIVSAHAPIGVVSNDDIVNASMISNPEKSFVVYTELLESMEAQYYHFPMKKGQIIYGSFQVPGPGSMVPDIVIIGPGIEVAGNVPSFVEVTGDSKRKFHCTD